MSNGTRVAFADAARRTIAFLAALVLVAVSAPAAIAASPRDGGELVVGIESDIVALDAAFAYDTTTTLVMSSITEGIMEFEGGTKLVPRLAESVENPDPLTWIYHIRRGVTFQDGSPMTADDVVFSMERTRDPEAGNYLGWMYSSVDTIEKVDDYTVKVTLAQPDAFWQYVPATMAGKVISKAYFEAHQDTYGRPEGGAMGTGPFTFVRWESGDLIELARNDAYWDKANGGPYLDRIIFKVLPEATTRVAGLQTGEIGAVIQALPGDQLPIVASMEGVDLQTQPSYYAEVIAINTQRPPFDDVKVRQALGYALDKVAVRKSTNGDYAADAEKSTTVPPWLWTFDEDLWRAGWDALPSYAVDLDKAKQLLDESGVADQLNGKVITTDSNEIHLGQALALQDALSKLGYSLDIEKITVEELNSRVLGEARDYDLITTSWAADYPDPASNLVALFTSENTAEGGANFANYTNDEVDTLLHDQMSLLDTAERTQKMVEAQAIIAEDAPLIIVDFVNYTMALDKDFTGYTISPMFVWESWAKDVHLVE
jgi:peptide/nickel transport system substrate-binding protein